MRKSAGGIFLPGANWGATKSNLKGRGYRLPNSNYQATIEAKKAVESVKSGKGTAADLQNRAMMHQMRHDRLSAKMGGGMNRTASNLQMVLPKVRQPLGSLMDKGVPFQVQDPDELIELRRWCNTPDAPVWMADYTFKPIGEIDVGDQVIGWDTHQDQWRSGRRELTRTTVLAVNRRIAPEVVKVTFASGRTAKCTPDHEWLRYYVPGADGRITNGGPTNPDRSFSKRYDSEYAPLQMGSIARSVIAPTQELDSIEKIKAASWLAGIIDGEGSWSRTSIRICQSNKHNPHIVSRIDAALDLLGITYKRHETIRNDPRSGSGYLGGGDQMVRWDLCRGIKGDRSGKNRQQLIDLYNWARPAKFDKEHMDSAFLTKNFGEPDQVVSIESLGPGEVVSMQTTTGNYTAWGFASKNCRLFYSTHHLVPLLVDIYSKFPVTGMEFVCKDPKIEKFYESMFMDDLNYEDFLPNGLLREYFVIGEVSSLAHFNEELGIWSSEEILNPDMIRVSKSLFVEQERVQLLVKDLVESLRTGPQGMSPSQESPSEKFERTWEYKQLVENYPEIIQAAMQDDGLDISDALVSRMVNKAAWWDLRGTPFLLRSFPTLMLEESLNAAQDAVCDRLYAPLIVATLGLEGAMGDGEPWLPDPAELEDLRDDIQSALAADFKLIVHNFGLNIESVFGRESVPRFDTDFDRTTSNLLTAWGIGQSLIMGGTGAGGTYASSAINREVCEQLMRDVQLKAIRHMRKRMEVVAEAQEHYDFEMKGGIRKPIYREIVEYNEETGEQEIVRVPKLLIPDIKFATLNLRDEATERGFVSQLKQAGVPISDKTLAINIPFEFEEELERQSSETYDKGCAQAESYKVLQERCDAEDWPYPAELNQHLQSTIQTRAMLAQAEMAEGQNKQLDQQMAQASPAGMMGLLPGTTMQPLAGGGSEDPNPADGALGPGNPSDATAGQGAPMAAPTAGGSAGVPSDPSALGYGSLTASYKVKPPWLRASTVHGPRMGPPQMSPTGIPVEIDTDNLERPRNNQTRPPESDEMRTEMPKKARRKSTAMPGKGEPEIPPGLRGVLDIHALKRMSDGPSSYKKSHNADDSRIEAAIQRRAATNHPHLEDLIYDPNFYGITNMQQYEREIQADWPAISAGKAPDAARLLQEMVEQYEAVTGISVYGAQYIHASAKDSTAEGELGDRKGQTSSRSSRNRGRRRK